MSVDPEVSQDKPEPPNPWQIALGAGSSLVGCVLAGVFLGLWLDKKLKTAPWLMIVGSLFGIGVGLYELIKVVGRPGGKRKS